MNPPPAPARNNLPIRRNIRGVGLTYSNIQQQLQGNPIFQRRVQLQDDEDWAFVPPTRHQLALQLLQLPDNDPQHIIVAQEHHQDGALHFHVYIQWLVPHANVGTDYFDIWGMHPNIVQVINQDNWVRYIQKEDAAPFIWVPIFFLDASDDSGNDSEGFE